jgi:antitoxin (DNA-binding transcriptional repressor) of toxin-antitoxin stability system
MPTVSLQDAASRLPDLIHELVPGEVLVITKDDKPVAELTAVIVEQKNRRQSGTMKGTVLYMAEDFDAPLEDFKEYME